MVRADTTHAHRVVSNCCRLGYRALSANENYFPQSYVASGESQFPSFARLLGKRNCTTSLDIGHRSSLDFIYLDGSHFFSDLSTEIQISLQKLRKGGVLCGDGLEVTPTPDLLRECEPQREVDVIFLRSGQCVHPGVLCAVGQHLKGVVVDNGHWRYLK